MKKITKEDSIAILRKMCEVVGLSYDAVSFMQPNWYELHTWTPEQEQESIEWLAGFLLKHKYVTGISSRKNKERARHEAQKINMQYGWKTEASDAKQTFQDARNDMNITNIEIRTCKHGTLIGQTEWGYLFCQECIDEADTPQNNHLKT